MSYLLDTCILSKARKNHPEARKLILWLDQQSESSCFISTISLGEIQMGISRLKESEEAKRRVFENWLLGELIPRFERRILGLDQHTCLIWGRLRGEAQKRGNSLPVVDTLIAATAIQHQLILVTENTKDFQKTGVPLLNPLISSLEDFA